MTLQNLQYTNLTPKDGIETTANQMIDNIGTPISADEVYKYIRVIGSKLTNLEPHFWGEGLAIAKFPGARRLTNYYYISRAIRRIEITVCKRYPVEKEVDRKENFNNISGIGKYLKTDTVTPWQDIPAQFGRRRYLMYLCQEKPDQLLRIGYQQSAIDRCLQGGNLKQPSDKTGKALMRDGKQVQFQVHHRVPLQGGGSNDIENLCLVDQTIHNPFFHKGDDPKLDKMKTGEVCKIALTVPQPYVDIIAVDLNAWVFIDKSP